MTMADLTPAEQDTFLTNLKAVNEELDLMVNYWQLTRPNMMFPDAVLNMHDSLRRAPSLSTSAETEDHLYRLLVIAVARLAGEQ